MGYKPPYYEVLFESTAKLQALFNHKANRYILPENLLDIVDELEEGYKKNVSAKSTWLTTVKPDSHRLDQIAFIKHLKNDLSISINSNKESEKKQAMIILLGAVFYRLIRLEESYNINIYISYLSSYISNLKNCALYQTLVQKFKIFEKEYSLEKSSPLDPFTVFTCCTALRNYLKQKIIGENVGSVAQKFAYIKNDNDFFSKLEKIIENAATKAKPIQAQLDYIIFLQSIGKALTASDKVVLGALEQLALVLAEKVKLLENEQYLSIEDIKECFNKLIPSPKAYVKLTLEKLWPNQIKILKNGSVVINDKEQESFLKIMRSWLISQSKYILMGAYLLCLKQCNESHGCLKNILHHVLEIKLHNELDEETFEVAIEQFQLFLDKAELLEKAEGTIIDYAAWGSLEYLKRQVELSQGIEEAGIRLQ